MKKFIISISVIAALFFVVDRVGGLLMKYCFQHTNAKTEVKVRYMANEASEDMVLFGTSRCCYHYVPSILADSLHMSVYNGGISDGNNIYTDYILLNLLLNHHCPKVVCLDLMPKYWTMEADPFSRTSFFAGFFGQSAKADSVYRDAGTYWRYKISHLYRYNAKGVEAFGGLLVNHRDGEDHGYFTIEGSHDKSMTIYDEELYHEADSLKLKYVHKFVDVCRAHGILLVFVISPRYSISNEGLYRPLQDIAEENGIPFLDYHSSRLFHDCPELFRDNGHLLEEGAKAYTSIFASDLKSFLY